MTTEDTGAEAGFDTPPDAAAQPPVIEDLARTLEAVLMVADEPLSLVALATGLGVPVPAFAAIDHVMTSPRLVVTAYDTVEVAGADHRGVLARISGSG